MLCPADLTHGQTEFDAFVPVNNLKLEVFLRVIEIRQEEKIKLGKA